MSIHPTLKIAAKGSQQRSVLTRIERIKSLMEKDLWKDGRSVTGLPKIKLIKVKFKKEKAAEKPAEGQAAATGAAGEAGGAPAVAASGQKAAKTAEQKPAKSKEK